MSRFPKILIPGVCVSALTIGALAAVTFSPFASSTDEPPLGDVTTITNASQIELPLDAYVPSGDDVGTVEHGVWAAIHSCMASFGFEYDAPPWYESDSGMFPMVDGRVSHAGLFGLFDMERAQRSGYHADLVTPEAERAMAEQRVQQEQDDLYSHSPGYVNVLLAADGGGQYEGRAIPAGGCFKEGQSSIYTHALGLVRLHEEIGGQAWRAASDDSRVLAVYRQWSKCMAEAGFSYQTPWEANEHASGDRVTDTEISTAVADVSCKQETNLVGVYSAVDSAYQRDLIEQRSSELHSAQVDFDHAVSRSNALIAANPVAGHTSLK